MEYSKSDMRKFHNYDLPEDKLEKFEKQLKNKTMNESFENFKLSEQLSAELYVPGYLDLLKEKKNTFLNDLPTADKKRKLFYLKKYVLGIAASICVLVASVFLFNSQQGNQSIQEIISVSAIASLNLDHLGTVERGEAGAAQNPIVELYKNGKYAKVIEDVAIGETSKMLQLLEARSFMHLGDYEEAINLLQGLNTTDFPQRDALLWSMVETELALHNQGNAKKYLREIIQNKYPNYKKAKFILSKNI